MIQAKNGQFIEPCYVIADEGKDASLFGIGNGYFGLRGSFEEFGDVMIQGCYVRGVFDEVLENPAPYSVNTYMKRYYFDAEKLKEFEYEDCCINIGDIQAFRIYIGGELMLPWNYEIKEYERKIDYTTGGVKRVMTIADQEGHETRFTFYKVCSFSSNHLFLQKMTIEKLNHDLDIQVRSGIDFLVKTEGMKKSRPTSLKREKGITRIHSEFGDKYHMNGDFTFQNEVDHMMEIGFDDTDKFYSTSYQMTAKKATICKKVLFYSNIDPKKEGEEENLLKKSYEELFEESRKAFIDIFSRIDVKITGNDEYDSLLRYANYQTMIGFDRFDSVHSLSAKNLTSEKYNQFVWWDCEIYQLPYFLLQFPKEAKSLLEYRYRCLPVAKENAKKDGYRGAKFAFCSSVDGNEQVWIYAKHPFLQIHIDSDIAYGILNYYKHTGDTKFLLEKGMEMIENIMVYFYTRSTYQNGKYHLLNVTGTDEHHDYVNDDAYTNYEVSYVLKEFLKLLNQLPYELKECKKEELLSFDRDLYLPQFENKILPQFDGYLSLSKDTILEGNSNPAFQMKQSALYHLCQTIKQPDVLLLYTYLDIGFHQYYKENNEFYQSRCEASSSLTYPVHAIASIDNDDETNFFKNFENCLKIDIDDLHGGAREGIHAGCLTGSYLAIFRGLLGIEVEKDAIRLHPHHNSKIERIELSFIYHGEEVKVEYDNKQIRLSSKKPFSYLYQNGRVDDVYDVTLIY